MRTRPLLLALLAPLLFTDASADPCGMVPPVWIPDDGGMAIERIGEQQTYAFFRNGVETIALRPGFSGKVDEFGMLIPFPSPPTIRKLNDDTFAHIKAVVDPPKVHVQIYDEEILYEHEGEMDFFAAGVFEMEEEVDAPRDLTYNEVRVLREEAVGMYEVAVLEAGSAAALSRWMEENEYRYPEGMDGPVNDYVGSRWCFVAIKTKVGQMPGVTPSPGMREVTPDLPAGSTFDGHVQGMAFRFEVDEPVIPMRLSTFNGDDTHNIVYLLADEPVRLQGIEPSMIKRQIPGKELFEDLTGPLDLLVSGGTEDEALALGGENLAQSREPSQYNGIARDLFASDLLAARTGQLALAFEDEEKELLNISEALGLRGASVDALHAGAVAERQQAAVDGALGDIKEMTLTVIDGDFPRDFLRDNNLFASAYEIPRSQNDADAYQPGPADLTRTYYR